VVTLTVTVTIAVIAVVVARRRHTAGHSRHIRSIVALHSGLAAVEVGECLSEVNHSAVHGASAHGVGVHRHCHLSVGGALVHAGVEVLGAGVDLLAAIVVVDLQVTGTHSGVVVERWSAHAVGRIVVLIKIETYKGRHKRLVVVVKAHFKLAKQIIQLHIPPSESQTSLP
jgi:hypothetical protein